ncbi:MAG: DNA translocase FtsK 4TM domain-containing protein [Bacilli bacterium]|nr:DNA translocase FtsK 4TM domain-containing protein [Bacilli bacterium]
MAKKKVSKTSTGTKNKVSIEFIGLILILIGVIGIGVFGPVGSIIKQFAIFLVGTYCNVLVLALIILGLYFIIKRDTPKFYSIRFIGIYILSLSILGLSHMKFVENSSKFKDFLELTIERLMSIEGPEFTNLSNAGGGIIGSVCSWSLDKLFDNKGAYIIFYVLLFFGVILLFNLSIGDVVDKIGNLFRRDKSKVKVNVDDEEDEDVEEVVEVKEPNRVIITSMEDAHNYNKNVEVEKVEQVNRTDIVQEKTNYRLPSLDLLDPIKKNKKASTTEFLTKTKDALEKVLNDFQIHGKVVEIHEGPTVTQFEVEVASGTKVSRITSINKEIALALAAKDVRIQAPIPGKSTIGVEIPNRVTSSVPIREVLSNVPSNMENAKILFSLGKDIMGRNCCADMAKMPHLLVAGSTGSGKSVCINSFIASILIRMRPDECKLVLVDPKKVELSNYNGVPHLMCPVVNDPKKASIALQKIVAEMEHRYDMFSEKNVKNITGYNEWVEKTNKSANAEIEKKLPYIVVIIDELADLMLVAAKEVEDSIMRITQMARAAGIHLIVATQRPSTDVITGVVKANIPSRISFAVASQIDSRTILDMGGAEKLLGKGDMLYLPMGENVPIRIQGNFISDEETQRLIDYVCKEQVAQYDNSLTESAPDHMAAGSDFEVEEYDDPLYNEIVEFAIETGKISASLVQRRFKVGYNRAARIIDLLEERGIIGPQNGSKPREVLVKLESSVEEE